MEDDKETSGEAGPLDNDYRIVLERWRDNVLPHLLASNKWTEVSAEFALTAVRSALVVNGGALVALPPLMEWAGDLQRGSLVSSSSWFVGGLLLAFVTLLLAYYNFLFMSQVENTRAHKAAIRINNPVAAREEKLSEIEDYKDQSSKEKRSNCFVALTQAFGVVSLVASVGCFLFGIWVFKAIVVGSDASESSACAIDAAVGQSEALVQQCTSRE